jgi:hypothetical protein
VDVGYIADVLEILTVITLKAKWPENSNDLYMMPSPRNRIGSKVLCLQHIACHRNFLEEERISKYVILIGLLRLVRCVKST